MATNSFQHEVFLSFSGDDTRYGFTDHLYNRLIDRGIQVYRDSQSLHVGEKIDQLLEAITASKILVPIISIHYASSEWCLKEFLQILKCSKLSACLVLPIFYKVKPSDIRDQKGQFGEEFQRFKDKHSEDMKLVQELEQAFKDIVSLKGWESDKFADGYEDPLVKEVVKRIFKELRKTILDVPDFLVGVEEHLKEIMKMVDAKQSNDAKIIAIHGMGGIGKTTLAKVLYNKLFDRFDSCSFVPNIREASLVDKGVVDLQKQVISDLLTDKSVLKISHVDEGKNIIKSIFKGKRLLLLLDDVNDQDQLKKLAVENNWFRPESVVIITTRNKDVTKASAVNLSYELNGLSGDQSYELFYNHAFGRDASCPSNLETIAKGIVSTTGGLPLAVEVIGCLLYLKSEDFWRDTLKKLRRIPHDKVLDRLMLSYEALKYEQQQIFLDIACFPSYMLHYEYAFYMWDACGFYPGEGIETLESLSLIKVRDKIIYIDEPSYIRREIVIHDQLRDLGWEMVRKEHRSNIGMCSRLLLHGESMEVMEQRLGTPNIQALLLYTPPSNEIHFTSQQFEGMENLRFLYMYDDVHLTGDFKNLFSNIIWLSWGPAIDNYIDIMGINFNPRKLVILTLNHTNITEHWKGWNQVKNLKVLSLCCCEHLTMTPDFSAVEGLEELVLRDCSNLKEIHPSIRKFRKTLKVLDVRYCSKLEELPIKVGEMEELRELQIGGTSISGIKRLEYYLDTVGSRVERLELDLMCCSSLINVPEAIGKLNLLTSVNLSFTGITQLPDSIGDLNNLESLDIHHTPIKCLPASIEKLSKLRHLDLTDCKELESLPNLPCGLTSLRFHGDSVETLPDFSNLTNLKRLRYKDVFERRNRALDLRKLNQLETLEITHSGILFAWSTAIDLDKASEDINLLLELPLSLKQLIVSKCQTFRTFPSSSNMKNLSRLTLKDCFELNHLELEGAESLMYLQIKRCIKLSKFSGVGTMVKDLILESLDALQSLPNLSASKKLKNLEISKCINPVEIQGLEDVKGLETLKIKDCCSLERIANLSHLKMLTTLVVYGCEKLSSVQGIEKLTSLTELCISGPLWDSLNLLNLKRLKKLEISECSNLVEIQGLEDVECLQTLKIEKCCSFERIANLSQLKMLTTLELRDCENLSDVQGIEKMTSLTELYISEPWRDSLDLSQLTNLRRSEISLELPTLDEEEESQSDLTHQREGKEAKVIQTHLSRMCDKMTAILGSLCW